jgi:hypothetical protein
MVIGREDAKALAINRLPGPGILTTKVSKLSPNSIVYQVCWALTKLKGTHIESFDEKTVLSLVKRCHKVFCPQITRSKSTTRSERRHQFTKEMIMRRRKNGSL